MTPRTLSRLFERGSRGPQRSTDLTVERVDGVDALLSLRGELDAVNAASAQPSPFHDVAFVATYARHSEKAPGGVTPRTFVVRDGASVVGWVSLAQLRESLGPGLRANRLDFVTHNDCDRPTVVSRAGEEVRVANALLDHLSYVETDWSLVELRSQVAGAPFHRAAHARAGARLRVRDIPLDPYTEVTVRWADVHTYFADLSKKMRSNVSRQARHLFAAGDVQLLTAHGAEATSAMWDAFVDLEQRSWKRGTNVAMSRSAQRLAFYRELARGNAAMDPWMVGVVLDGVLVAGLLNGNYGDRSWCVEMSFDETRADLGPGQLLLLLAIGDAIEKGQRSVGFYQLQGYFKVRWNADEIPAVNLQLMRRPGLHDAKAVAGDAHRVSKARLDLWRAQRSAHGMNAVVAASDTAASDTSDPRASLPTSTPSESAANEKAVTHNVVKHAKAETEALALHDETARERARTLLARAIVANVPGLTVHRGSEAEAMLPFPLVVAEGKGKPGGKKRGSP